MHEFTFRFKFVGTESSVATLFSWNIKAYNLKEAVKVWTNYVQSGEQLILLAEIEKNGIKIQT